MGQTERSSWIWTPEWRKEDEKESRLVCFRRELDYAGGRTVLRVTADTRYKLYVNGVLAEFGPSKGDDRIWYVDEVDITGFLHPGRNVLAAEVLRCADDPQNSNHSLFRTDMPGFYLEGVKEGEWRCHMNRGVSFYAEAEGFSPLHIHEKAAPDPACAGWKEPGFNDSGWEAAEVYPQEAIPDVLKRLTPRTIPFMYRRPGRLALPELTIAPHTERSIVLDAGEELCAFLKLTVSGGAGARIQLLQSECYAIPTEDGYRKQNRTDAENGCLVGYSDWYTVSGERDEECYEPYWFRTFRYLRLTVRTEEQPLTLRSLTYEETGYPLEVRTNVETSDPSHAGIWDISLRTLRRCMHETYIDCPFYEQLQYAMDTRSQILYTYAVSADDRLARKAIDDFSRAQRPDGLLNCCYPNKNVNVIPGFSIYYILMVYDHMMYFGDKALVHRCLPVIERILDYFDRHLTGDGLVDKIGGTIQEGAFWSFIDWAEEWLPTQGMPAAGCGGPITAESLLYVLGLQKAAELAEYAGQEDAAADFRSRASQVQKAIRARCMDENGMITDGPDSGDVSQHSQVFGILTNTLTAEEGRRNLLATIRDRSYTQCTVAMCFYLFRAMEQTGLYAYTDQYWEIWREMLDNQCTTCVEADVDPRSECHAWGALALYELPSVILGVRPGAPGYEKIEVCPVPGYLDHASGTVHTPKGDIQISWAKNADGIRLSVSCADEVRELLRIL